MKRMICIAACMLLTACGGGGGGGAAFPVSQVAPAQPQTPAKTPDQNCSVDLYGDSILYGYVSATERLAAPPAARIKDLRPAYTVTDHSVPGATATGYRDTFNNTPRTARMVVLQFGANDLGKGYDITTPMQGMKDFAQAEGRIVVMTGISQQDPKPATFDAYQAAIFQVATTATAYADWGSVPADTSDGVHPKQAMANALTDKLISALDSIAPECSQP